MRILLHIGPDAAATERLQRIAEAKRSQLAAQGVLYPRSPGPRNHTRLAMAARDPDAIDALRFHRRQILPADQAALREELRAQLAAEIRAAAPDVLFLSAHQFGSQLTTPEELARLRDLIAAFSSDIRILAQVDDPARMLLRRYAAQLSEGRTRSLALELRLLAREDYWSAALSTREAPDPRLAGFPEIQGAVHWIDLNRLQSTWEGVFGAGRLSFHSTPKDLWTVQGTKVLHRMLNLPRQIGKAAPAEIPQLPSDATLTRLRRFNSIAVRLLSRRPEMILPRQTWKRLHGELAIDGDAPSAGALSAVSERFSSDLNDLQDKHEDLIEADVAPDIPQPAWTEADPCYGFRASQYLAAFLPRIARADTATTEAALAQLDKARRSAVSAPPIEIAAEPLSPQARERLPDLAKANLARLRKSPYAPHNRLGAVNEEALAAAFTPAPPRPLPEGQTGRLIVACMKDEAPYILEWIAYHRCIGVDNFLIYTNDCSDGTDRMLDRLQALGIVTHRDNTGWSGKSPQQHALDRALEDPALRQADWIAHIDVDEFINIRCGNGTLDDLFARVPGATNIAMTWRLFGHNGVTGLSDSLVTEQFDRAAPKYCPKPHTVWGFKTLMRNIGAYGKLSCHRPNKLVQGFDDKLKWVNGSGKDITSEVLRNGWRSSRSSVGYDLVQLNHYALRSAESFLVKRQRGRALHVDRSIGLNYWIRMDWSVHRDITIQRNLPRLRAAHAALMADAALARLHAEGLDWHRTRAAELRAIPEWAALFDEALALDLTETERVAYALALDMES